MIIGSTLENDNLEKRIAITPEIVKKYFTLVFKIIIIENYF
jgi:NAD(P) transhydrogenase subunit alpha